MKKMLFMAAFVVASLASCQQENVSVVSPSEVACVSLQSSMENTLQTAAQDAECASVEYKELH